MQTETRDRGRAKQWGSVIAGGGGGTQVGTEARSKRRMIHVGETLGACHRLNAGSNRERRALAQHAARALRHGVYSRRRRTNRVQIGLERQRPAALARIFPPSRTLRLQHRHQLAPTVSTVRWAQERGGCVYSGAEANEGRKRNQCGRSQRQSQKSVSRCAVVGPPGSPGIHPIHGPISRWHGDFSSRYEPTWYEHYRNTVFTRKEDGKRCSFPSRDGNRFARQMFSLLIGGLDLHAKGLPKWMAIKDVDHLSAKEKSRIVSAAPRSLAPRAANTAQMFKMRGGGGRRRDCRADGLPHADNRAI
jgi:hypothetical protein